MGISGLLPLLKSIHRPVSLKKFEGKTLGVDAYGWLHRGTVACAMELANGQPTKKFVDFCMHRVRMLQHFGVIPFLVFDGDYLPSKAATEEDRSKRREDSKRAGFELVNAGKLPQAYLEFQKAVDVTPEMARQLIDELKTTGVQYVVAPYEADAQMVYLERKGIIHGILSEDSDLLVFGAKCLLTKLDQYGNCVEINKADFCACKDVTLTGWSDKEFRHMAILSGCDYLASINNMGLKTAYRMLRKHKNVEKVLRMMQFDGKYHVPKGYLEAFNQAELTFLHQRVFCPKTQRLVFHTEPEQPIDEEKMTFIGGYVSPEIAQGVARGDLNPMTKQPIVMRGIRNRMAASTPLTSRPQYRTSVSSADLKKGVSIEAFFKPTRTPLAELDPNCFTPSPSQQDLLRRNSGPWMASPVPRPYLNRSATEPELPQSAPPSQLSMGRHMHTPSISEPRPPKRARLCADDDATTSPNQRIELGRSKFFANEASEPSPSASRSFGKSRRSKKTDVTIFSDDSVEEAMLSLPDFDGFKAGSAKKVGIFQETTAASKATDITSTQASTKGDSQSQDTQITIPSLTASSSVQSSAELPGTPTDAALPMPTLQNFRGRFSLSASQTTSPQPAAVRPILTPSTSLKPSKIPLAVKFSTSIPKSAMFSTGSNSTPLQRLGISALNKPKFPMTPSETPKFQARSSQPRRSILGKGSVPFPEVTTPNTKYTIDPASIPLPIPDESENAALQLNGSEDHMVPDSEEEDESTSPMGDKSSKIDLTKFIFAR